MGEHVYKRAMAELPSESSDEDNHTPIQPFMYEPEASSSSSDVGDSGEESDENDGKSDDERLKNTNW